MNTDPLFGNPNIKNFDDISIKIKIKRNLKLKLEIASFVKENRIFNIIL